MPTVRADRDAPWRKLAKPLAIGEERGRGLWIRELTLENPPPTRQLGIDILPGPTRATALGQERSAFDELVAKGALVAQSIDVEDVHTDSPMWRHVMTLPRVPGPTTSSSRRSRRRARS